VSGRATDEVIYVDLVLPARYNCGFRFSGDVCWYFGTDGSGRLIGIIFKGPVGCPEAPVSRCQPTPCNIPGEKRPHGNL
jgi:hypothetical protein